LRTGPHPLLEWLSFLSLFAAALITFKGAESPDIGHGRMGVIGALVFVPSEGV